MINGFINSAVSTLEKRFQLQSSDTGLIASSYDIATVICLVPVSYLGGLGSKPRWIGFGIILMGIGSIVFSLPHYTTKLYSDEDFFVDVSIADGCVKEQSNATTSPTNVFCEVKETGLSNYKYVLILGQLLHGIGATPLYTLAVTYIHENVKQKWSSVYTGLLFNY